MTEMNYFSEIPWTQEKTASSTYCVHHKLFNDKSEHIMFD